VQIRLLNNNESKPFAMLENHGLCFFFGKNFPQMAIPSESSMRKTDVYDLVTD